MNAQLKSILKYTLFAGIAVFFIYMAFGKVDVVELWSKIQQANFLWIGLACLAGLLSNVSRALRWTMIAEPLGYHPSKTTSFHAVMVGYLVNFAIPRGGEVTRAAMLSKVEKMPLPTVIGSIVAERVMDLVFMGLVMLLALTLQYDTILGFFSGSQQNSSGDAGGSWKLIILLVIGVLGIAFLVFRKKLPQIPLLVKINNLIGGFLEGIRAILKIRRPGLFLLHSVIIWLMYFLQVYFCFFSIPETSHLGLAAGLTALVVSTIAVLLPAPGGIGTFHFFMPIGLQLYGISPQDGLAFATIAHASQMLMFMVFGTISLVVMITLQRKALAA